MSCDKVIACRIGAACNFEVTNGEVAPYAAFPAQYTAGYFHVRDEWKDDSPLRIECTTAGGGVLLTNAANGIYNVLIGATVTAALAALAPPAEGLQLAGLLRVWDPGNVDDVVDYEIPFVLLPGL